MQLENDKVLLELIGKRLTELRKKAGYTSQETFAYDKDLPRALYGKYEKGANLTITSLYKVVKAHKMTFEEFFSEGFETAFSEK
jgi:transcriptional regulator with XRE-family HTH domain